MNIDDTKTREAVLGLLDIISADTHGGSDECIEAVSSVLQGHAVSAGYTIRITSSDDVTEARDGASDRYCRVASFPDGMYEVRGTVRGGHQYEATIGVVMRNVRLAACIESLHFVPQAARDLLNAGWQVLIGTTS